MPRALLHKGLGPVLADIALDSIQPLSSISPAKKNLANLTSYNLFPKHKRMILVPGSPPLWTPPKTTHTVRPDKGKYILDPNGYIFRNSPLEPLFRAILATTPDFNMDGIDLVTDRKNLRSLLGFVSGSSGSNKKKPFRINLEVINSTLLFSRYSPRTTHFVDAFNGYGHEYEKASTHRMLPIRDSIVHNRVICYTLGTVKIILRFEVDACMRVPAFLVDKSRATKTNPTLTPTPTGFTVLDRGDPAVAASRLAEIKTRPATKLGMNTDALSQMWFSQTPLLCKGRYHGDGVFRPPTVANVEASGRLAAWEERNQDLIRRLVRLLEVIKQTVGGLSQTKLAIVNEGEGVLKVYAVKDGQGHAIPGDLRKMWRGHDTGVIASDEGEV
ncbi:hypothetical protein BJY04DRAFT_214511 [Aspergillus karnatakaensis]|uniref:uncharacterized protein n=1 Tax=Aspergillus karnatakaensis TaxID=1810916 RepID=UPI003CCDDE88